MFFNGVKGETGVIVQSDPSISINGSLLRGGSGFLCRVQNIACYRMRMGFIGVQVAHSVADDLNIYYEQFPCVGRPKFQSRKYTNEN